jgi:hypothetical protein
MRHGAELTMFQGALSKITQKTPLEILCELHCPLEFVSMMTAFAATSAKYKPVIPSTKKPALEMAHVVRNLSHY